MDAETLIHEHIHPSLLRRARLHNYSRRVPASWRASAGRVFLLSRIAQTPLANKTKMARLDPVRGGGGRTRLWRRLFYPGGCPRAAGGGRAFDSICQRVGPGAAD